MKIYLLANNFPFGRGETFIKDELESIVFSQKEISICPLEYKRKKKETEYKNVVLTPSLKQKIG